MALLYPASIRFWLSDGTKFAGLSMARRHTIVEETCRSQNASKNSSPSNQNRGPGVHPDLDQYAESGKIPERFTILGPPENCEAD